MAYERFTHLAEVYGIRCYYNESTLEICGVDFINKVLLSVVIFLAGETFEVKLIERL